MIIAMIGPVIEDIESSYEFLTTTNDFVFMNIEDLFRNLSSRDYSKYVIGSKDLLWSLLKKIEQEYGSCVVYGDSTFINAGVLTDIVKNNGIIVITAREDTSSYSEFNKYNSSDIDSSWYTPYVECYEKLSDINDSRVFFNDVLSDQATLYDVIDLIDEEEVDDSNDTDFDPAEYITDYIAHKENNVNKAHTTTEKTVNKNEGIVDTVVDSNDTSYDSAIRRAMENLGMEDIADEVLNGEEPFNTEANQTINEKNSFMNEPESEEFTKKEIQTKTVSTSHVVEGSVSMNSEIRITLLFPEETTLEHIVKDGIKYAAVTIPASMSVPFSNLIRTPIVKE